jgi:hypothetical protein
MASHSNASAPNQHRHVEIARMADVLYGVRGEASREVEKRPTIWFSM